MDPVLQRLKDSLPWGAQAEVARVYRVTPSAVSQVLTGDIQNDEILRALIQKAKDYKKNLAAIRKEMEDL